MAVVQYRGKRLPVDVMINELRATEAETDVAKMAATLKRLSGTLQVSLDELVTLRKIASPDTVGQSYALGIYGIIAATDDITVMKTTLEAFLIDHLLPHCADAHGQAKAEDMRTWLMKILKSAASNDYSAN